MKKLETQRLIIRPFTEEDLEEAYQLLDVDIQWSGPGFTIEQRRRRLQFYRDLANWSDASCLYGYRAILLKPEEALIGMIGLHPDLWTPPNKAIFWSQLFPGWDAQTDPQASLELGLGFALASGQRHHGFATEAACAVLSYAFQELHIMRVFAITDRENESSKRLMQRLNMRTAVHPDPKVLYPAFVGVMEELCSPSLT